MFHASVPLNADGSLKEVEIQGKKYAGINLMKKTGHLIRKAFSTDTTPEDREFAKDYIWYLWCGKDSPLFDKDKMATFERYFIKDKATHAEEKGYYYVYNDNEAVVDSILDNFGVEGKHRHIINGHVPVKLIKGETPIKANGKLLVIDGGFAKAYQSKTGIAGYTLTYNSYGFLLAAHEPFESLEKAIETGSDIHSDTVLVQHVDRRKTVADTDIGQGIKETIAQLEELLEAYRTGILVEA
jgi:fructose-1,6-bisphosphatase-3